MGAHHTLKDGDKPLLILCGDIHLSMRPPAARSAEPDWFGAMARSLRELRELQEQHNVPVVCAGDVFDRWNAPAELINFAIAMLPRCFYAIPGQHDLANHSLDHIRRTAYWTLVEAGAIHHLAVPTPLGITEVTPFAWGVDLHPVTHHDRVAEVCVAVCHRYAWVPGTEYPGAPAGGQLTALAKQLAGFDVLHFGDNHKGWLRHGGLKGKPGALRPVVACNCGGFMPRRTDERLYEPWVGVLVQREGALRVVQHHLSVGENHWCLPTTSASSPEQAELSEFLQELAELSADRLDFVETLKAHLDHKGATAAVRALALEACSG